ncbi:unnamed protein product [Lymnaea stagnalis]|uniref:COMM domain-containing protein n=1 Tax=Lymnaea stagnalis TaxID=6523 RepID=A0AAV2HRR6_LYMST
MAADKWESAHSLLRKASINDFGTLCHLVAESICRDGILDPGKYMSVWSLEEWWQVQAAVTDIMRKAVGRGWTNEKISEHVSSLDEPYKKVLLEVLTCHKQVLRRKLVEDTTAVSHAVLSDFDWKLKLAMASDKLASIQEPLLQLDLDIRDANGQRRQVFLELDKVELSKLITSLESCSKSVQQLTTSA